MNTTIYLLIPYGIGLINMVSGQNVSEFGKTAKQPVARIPHSLEVPVFIPPAPPVEKKIPTMRVDSSVTVPTKSARALTILRGEASKLPDLPPPVVSTPHVARELTLEEIEQQKIWRRHQLNLGATIYDHRVSVIHWQHPDTREFYEVICGFDVGLLAGVGRLVHNDEFYTLMLMHSQVDSTKFRNYSREWFPDFSAVTVDSITVVKGNPLDPIGMAPVSVVRDIIASEKPRLIDYQAARREHQQAAAEWQKAHPVVPRDETFWFKPHRGSRYLADPKPEATAR
jgi:hypothetical protein